MAQEIIDLDELAPSDTRVKLGGKTYTLPGDIPVELYLRINAISDGDDANEEEVVQDLRDRLLALFQVHQPDMDSLPMGLTQLMRVIPAIYGSGSGGDPDPTTRSGTRSTPRGRARSRS